MISTRSKRQTKATSYNNQWGINGGSTFEVGAQTVKISNSFFPWCSGLNDITKLASWVERNQQQIIGSTSEDNFLSLDRIGKKLSNPYLHQRLQLLAIQNSWSDCTRSIETTPGLMLVDTCMCYKQQHANTWTAPKYKDSQIVPANSGMSLESMTEATWCVQSNLALWAGDHVGRKSWIVVLPARTDTADQRGVPVAEHTCSEWW